MDREALPHSRGTRCWQAGQAAAIPKEDPVQDLRQSSWHAPCDHFGRKQERPALSAFLLLLHLCGPEARQNSQLFSAAQSRDQAGLLFSLAAKCVRMSSTLSSVVVIRDTAKQLFCPRLGTWYRALSADATTAFGLSPAFIVHDKLGQVRGPRSELYVALETATGAQEEPLSVITARRMLHRSRGLRSAGHKACSFSSN